MGEQTEPRNTVLADKRKMEITVPSETRECAKRSISAIVNRFQRLRSSNTLIALLSFVSAKSEVEFAVAFLFREFFKPQSFQHWCCLLWKSGATAPKHKKNKKNMPYHRERVETQI